MVKKTNCFSSIYYREIPAGMGVDKDEVVLDAYGLVDIDIDGVPEVFVQNKEYFYNVVFSIADGKSAVLANSFGATEIYFYEHGVAVQGGCGTGCMMSDCTIS